MFVIISLCVFVRSGFPLVCASCLLSVIQDQTDRSNMKYCYSRPFCVSPCVCIYIYIYTTNSSLNSIDSHNSIHRMRRFDDYARNQLTNQLNHFQRMTTVLWSSVFFILTGYMYFKNKQNSGNDCTISKKSSKKTKRYYFQKTIIIIHSHIAPFRFMRKKRCIILQKRDPLEYFHRIVNAVMLMLHSSLDDEIIIANRNLLALTTL